MMIRLALFFCVHFVDSFVLVFVLMIILLPFSVVCSFVRVSLFVIVCF